MSVRFPPTLLRSLQTFLVVVEAGSFSAAARTLGITQPSVSEQMRALEEHVRQPLFLRPTRTATLTVAGQRLREHARRVLQALDALERDLEGLREGTGGVLTLVASPVPGELVLPVLLPLFHARHPETVVRLAIADTKTAIARLLAHEVELAAIGGPFRHEGCTVEVLGRNELVPVAPPDHPVLHAETLTAAKLAQEPLVLREDGSGARAAVVAAFEAAGVPPDRLRIVAELGSTEAILSAVAAGLGIGFVSVYALVHDRDRRPLQVLSVADLAAGRDLLLVSARDHPLSPLAAAFRAFLLSEPIKARTAMMSRRAHSRPAGE